MSKSRTYNMVELFSGIGSQAKALEKAKIECNVSITCEWNIHAIVAYDFIHKNSKLIPDFKRRTKEDLIDELKSLPLSVDGKEEMPYNSLRCMAEETLRRIASSIQKTNNKISVNKLKGSDIPDDTDILTYSFPCQDISNVGAFHGYNKGIDRGCGSRSSLLWEVERILIEKRKSKHPLPKALVMENVPALLSERHIKNFDEWRNELESWGYYNTTYELNAINFGLPQNRPRLIMISINTANNKDLKQKLKEYYENRRLDQNEYVKKLKLKQYSLKSLLRTNYNNNNNIYKEEAIACQPNDTISRRAIWQNNPVIIDENKRLVADYVRTITTKQDRDPNSGNLFLDFDNGKSKFRYLTPRECFMLMGFDEKDYEVLVKNNFKIKSNRKFFTRDNMIRLAGNSIAVNMLEAVFMQVTDILDKFDI